MSSGDKRSAAIGFYTVVPHEQHGLFGGLLVLNHNGRPLEFHCTAPLKPNRAQEILYGATLEGVGRRLWTILLWVGVAWNIYRVFQLMNDFTYIVPTPIW